MPCILNLITKAQKAYEEAIHLAVQRGQNQLIELGPLTSAIQKSA